MQRQSESFGVGITMGTVKEVPETLEKYDENQKYSLIPFTKRVFIPDFKTRKSLTL